MSARRGPRLTALLLALAAPAAFAATAARTAPPADAVDPAEDPFMAELGYMQLHPDMEYRQLGMQSYRRGHLKTASEHFRRAGYYGDKPAQALLAEMYWKGEGVAADRALAYVWMDLAAERGYPDLVILRERYWAAMSEDQRRSALEQGPALYRQYGDPTVKPRYERRLTRLRNQTTGSHIGVDVGVRAGRADEGAFQEQNQVAGFYTEANWSAQRYWERQDRFWRARFGGRVDVGNVENLSRGEPAAQTPAPAAPTPDPDKPPQPR